MRSKEEIEWDTKKGWASSAIYHEIKSHPENEEKLPEDFWNDFDIFSKKYCAQKDYPLHIDKTLDYPSVEYIINVIRECDGLAFYPHLFLYRRDENKERMVQEILNSYEVDGIECYHNTFTNEQTEYLIEECKKRNYYMSGGSDYHGINKPNVEMAIGKGNLKIDKEIIYDWVDKCNFFGK